MNIEGNYKGKLKNGIPDGQGIYMYENGDTYEGKFKNGKKHGYGKLYEYNGCKYFGNWENDIPNGKGEYYCHNGEMLKGKFVNGLLFGYGKHYAADGKILYEGNFNRNLYQGYGIAYYTNGKKFYKGQWYADFKSKGSYPHGFGIKWLENGTVQKGMFHLDNFIKSSDDDNYEKKIDSLKTNKVTINEKEMINVLNPIFKNI
uniref:MORN repeat-containing protein n=1 Tax=viral metagenome TaxID=1070528 RepID=A0A6C0EBB4_9ZZZZ